VKENRSNCGEVDAYQSASAEAADDERLIAPKVGFGCVFP